MLSIRELRKKSGLTQLELARRVGVKPSIISRYESGKVKPKLKRMEQMAEIFGVDTKEFIIYNMFSNEDKNAYENEKIRNLKKRLLIANSHGKCELCGAPAPFTDENGRPFLQLLEIDRSFYYTEENWFQNNVVLCPNCFQQVTVLEDKSDLDMLKEKALAHDV